MKIYSLTNIENQEDVNMENARYFRGVSVTDLNLILKHGYMLPSVEKIPFDGEVIEYAIGDEYKDMDEEEIENFIKTCIWWYNGSKSSVKHGVNLTTDFENAKGYGDYVIAVDEGNTEIADISDAHSFARDAKGLEILGIYDVQNENWKIFEKVEKVLDYPLNV